MMKPTPLLKRSPLSGLYRRYPAQLVEVAGWQMAQHFGNPEQELQQLQTASVLVDWSHLGKIAISGSGAMATLGKQRSLPTPFPPLTAIENAAGAMLRLTPNDWMVLLNPGETATFLAEIDSTAATVMDATGALGCFALAGPSRSTVLERSTALNLRPDQAPPGSVCQTTLHTIRCTLYRRPDLDLILHPRSLSESLFEALLDVGIGVGLLPSGLGILPIHWTP